MIYAYVAGFLSAVALAAATVALVAVDMIRQGGWN